MSERCKCAVAAAVATLAALLLGFVIGVEVTNRPREGCSQWYAFPQSDGSVVYSALCTCENCQPATLPLPAQDESQEEKP
jgi:hypothetical protein